MIGSSFKLHGDKNLKTANRISGSRDRTKQSEFSNEKSLDLFRRLTPVASHVKPLAPWKLQKNVIFSSLHWLVKMISSWLFPEIGDKTGTRKYRLILRNPYQLCSQGFPGKLSVIWSRQIWSYFNCRLSITCFDHTKIL